LNSATCAVGSPKPSSLRRCMCGGVECPETGRIVIFADFILALAVYETG
jgi:hypothetical protein